MDGWMDGTPNQSISSVRNVLDIKGEGGSKHVKNEHPPNGGKEKSTAITGTNQPPVPPLI